MKPKFWLERWQKNEIGFHQAEHNHLLREYWPAMDLPTDSTVFVPLCGKSLDMRWLEHAGHSVVGVELAQVATQAYFADAGETAEASVIDRFTCYQGAHTRIYHGDIFDMTADLVADVAGLFDRAALIALPPDMRFRYVDHLLRIVPEGCRILLLAFEYDQTRVAGPPHAVTAEEVESLYGNRCDVQLLDSFVTRLLPPHFQNQGITQAVESVYLITKRE